MPRTEVTGTANALPRRILDPTVSISEPVPMPIAARAASEGAGEAGRWEPSMTEPYVRPSLDAIAFGPATKTAQVRVEEERSPLIPPLRRI